MSTAQILDASAYLSPLELFVLTGKKQRPAQIAWLKRNHWRHTVAGGNPRVAREYWRKRMVDGGEEVVDQPAEWTPGFLALQPQRKRA